MMEGTRCVKIETSSKIEGKIKTESTIEIDSIFYETDGKLEELDSELQEDSCAVMGRIKYENTEVAEEIETTYTEPTTLSETCYIPRSEQSLKFSGIMSKSDDYTPLTSLCRLCGTRSNSMVHMFSQSELQNNTIGKIEYCFPIEVKRTDSLPKEICHLCLEKLELCYQFHKTVEAAEKQFLTFDNGRCNKKQYKYFSDWDVHSNITVQKLPKTDTAILENSTILSNSMPRKETYSTIKPNEESGTESSSDEDQSTCNSLLTFPLHIWNDMEEKLRFEIKPSQKEEANNDSDDDIVVRKKVFNKRRSVEQNSIGNELIKCKNCRDNFETVNQCLAHSCIHTSKGYFPCCLCSAILRTEKECDKHRLEHKEGENLRRREVQTNNGNKPLQKSFREAKLKAKIKLNSEINSRSELHCKKCNKYIDSETSLRQHMLTVHKQQNKSFHNICEKELRCEIRLHRIVHSTSEQLKTVQSKRDFNLECKLCNKRFSSNETLEVHKKTDCSRPLVSTKKTFSCIHCGRRFRQKAHRNFHMRIHTEERRYDCDLCGKIFKDKYNRDCHRRIHTGERPYECDLCGKRFGLRSNRNAHRKIHTGDKLFKCSQCEKSFTTAGVLNRHSLIHSDAKPYSCHLCQLSFKTLKTRDLHLRIQHTDKRPYECPKCEKRFPTPGALTRHSVVHSDAKPYSCHLCHSSFKLLCARDLHLRIHTGEKPYKCDICGVCYTTNPGLQRHRKTKSCSKILAAESQK